jgi:hypothetical protein
MSTTINQPWSPTPAVICDFGWYATAGDTVFTFGDYLVNGQLYPPYPASAPYNTDTRYQVYETPINVAITFDAGTSVVIGLGLPYSVVPPGVSIVSYNWDLGDGNTATGPTVSGVVYNQTTAAPDTAVTLTVTDSLGRRSSTTHQLYLQDLSQIFPSGSQIRKGTART